MMNVKGLKKCLAGVSTLGLVLSLGACNNQDEQNSSKGYTLSDIVNSKEKHQIVVTDERSDNEEGHVVWAGFIGKGELDAIYLDGTEYDYGYKDLKGQNNKDFKQNLTDMGSDYEGKSKSIFTNAKAETKLYTNLDDYSVHNNDKLTDVVGLNAKFKDNDQFKYGSGLTHSVSKPGYNKVRIESNKKWITYTSGGISARTDDYQMHIKMGENKMEPKMENVEDTLKKYDNAKEEE